MELALKLINLLSGGDVALLQEFLEEAVGCFPHVKGLVEQIREEC